jgi:PD-(D/E)XK endonuclease
LRPRLPSSLLNSVGIRLDEAYRDASCIPARLRRVQCKTGRLVRGAVVFATTRYTGRKHRTYQDHEIDYFGVHCPDTDAVYLEPMKEVGPHTSAYLRVEPAKNNQAKGLRWAMDSEVRTKSEWCRC